MRDRVDFLATQGLAEWRGQRAVLATNLLTTLRDRELVTAGKALQDQNGQTYHPVKDGELASGSIAEASSSRAAASPCSTTSVHFRLVPWRPVVEQRMGQQVSAVVRGQSITWRLGRQRGIGI